MRFIVGYPLLATDPPQELLTQDAVASMAARSEAAGFCAFSLTEHPATPERWRHRGGHDAIDPFVGLAFAAAVTRAIRLLTFLTVVPYHQPFLLAKTAATLDRLSGGRLILGVGTGYLEGEFAAIGIDFAQRNALFEESVEVMRKAWTGRIFDHEGGGFRAEGIVCRPTPVSRPHPPIWIGGNSALTRRRVAQYAQGWMPIPTTAAQGVRRHTPPLESLDALARRIRDVNQHRERLGRLGPAEVSYMLQDIDARTDTSRYLERVRRLQEIGVGWVPAEVPGASLREALEFIDWFGENVIAHVGEKPAAPPVDPDRDAIVELVCRYGEILDRREFERLDEVFTADVEAAYPGYERIVGLDALVSFMRGSHAGLGKTTHRVLDVDVRVDGDRAVCRAAKRNLLRDGATAVVGRYLDELVRTAQGWRIRCRESHTAIGLASRR